MEGGVSKEEEGVRKKEKESEWKSGSRGRTGEDLL